ncbi:MAG TPA: hypothetical protein VK625_15205 [Flavitalea sp.]|nr:hypothetical protein [Flavitalea sp.]
MSLPGKTKLVARTIHNARASLTINAFGGALIDFHLRDSKINPLSFRFTEDQMPVNNKSGAPYQGHFLCLGRWGGPSVGEVKAGVPDHGHLANIMWTCSSTDEDQGTLNMHAESKLEGLKIDRTIQMDARLGLYLVTELVVNINPLGRLYNMVQHPTIAAPFLKNNMRIQCNASKGFHYKNYHDPEKNASNWPYGIEEDKTINDLRFCDRGVSSVFSFIVDEKSRLGWITAYSPDAKLLIGYLWLRQDYPWINLWKDWDKGNIRYCGLEFGTTGIHQPFMEILAQNKATVFNINTFQYIDAGERVHRRYLSFLAETPDDFGEIESVFIRDGSLFIRSHKSDLLMELTSEAIRNFDE